MNIKDIPLIILAAGSSSRMGIPKGILQLGERFWIDIQLEKFAQAGGRKAVIVLGYDSGKYFLALPKLRAARNAWCTYQENLEVAIVINEHPELGPFSSFQTALSWLEADAHPGVFLLPVDVPLSEKNVLEALVAATSKGVSVCTPTHEERAGHPVWLSSAFVADMRNVDAHDDDARLDVQIRKLPASAIRHVEIADETILYNFNTPQAWTHYSALEAQRI